MAKVLTDPQHYADIANAIRAKNGSSETYTPAQMAGAVEAIQTGGGMPEGFTAIRTGKFSLDADLPNYESSSGVTFQHNLGVIPDVVIVYKENDTSVIQNIFLSAFRVIDENAYKSQGIYNYLNGYASNAPRFTDDAIKNITESSATVTTNTEGQFRAGSYRWVAVKF